MSYLFVSSPAASSKLATPLPTPTPASSSPPPTSDQLASLTALPAAMVRSGKNSGGAARSSRLSKDGHSTSTTFDCFGKRPNPRNGISDLQSITCEMIIGRASFITSSSTAGAVTYSSKVFALSDFYGTAALTSVFDDYRLDQLEVWIETPVSNSNVAYPQICTAVDLDDGNVPAVLGAVADKPGAQVSVGPAGHYHKWMPHMAIAAYSGTFTSYSNVKASWIDCGSPSVQHFGIKAWTISSGGASTEFTISVRGVFTLRSPTIQ